VARGPTVSTTFNAKDKISKPMQKMKKNMKRFALAGGAAIAAASVLTVKAINSFATSGDEIAKTARKIGLSVEALQELRFAADRSGVSAEAFSDAMKKLNKNVGDLRAGTGMLTTYLNKSNPALKEQLKNATSNEEAFALLTDALAGIENTADRAALAQAAFGRAGQDLLIMTEDGAEGIKKLREEARKYGDIISDEAAAASEKYIDSLTNMKASMNALRNKALVPLMDKLQPLIQMVADYVAANQEVINQKIQGTFKKIGETVKFLSDQWKSGLIPAILAAAAAWLVITKAMAAWNAIVAVATILQTALNLAMSANVIGLIIIGVVALIAGIALLILKWDVVKASVINFAKTAWDWFLKLLDNPFFAALGTIFLPFITIPAMIIKHWEPIKEFFIGIWDVLKKIVEGAGKIAGKVGSFFGGVGDALSGGGNGRATGLIGRNDAALAGAGTTNSSELAVNFNNVPSGTSFRQTNKAPNITVTTGARGRL
jgi:hypothetical protein